MILISYKSIQAYYDYKKKYDFISPKHYSFCNVDVSPCCYYSTEYDEDYDNKTYYYEFSEAVQNGRIGFFKL